MAYCIRCGTKANDGERFCKNCGSELPSSGNVANGYQYQASAPKKSRTTNSSMLIFSIISTIFFSRILGIIALIFTIMASNETTDEGEASKLKTAKTLNVIALVLGIIAIIAAIAYVVLAMVFGFSILALSASGVEDLIEEGIAYSSGLFI